VIKIELSAWQKMIYDNISQKSALEFAENSGKVSTTTLTNLMMQLRKCCNHPYLFLRNYDDIAFHDWIFRCSGKFEVLDKILPKFKEFSHRVLIFTQMTHLMDIMQIYFDYKGIKHLRLDGSTKADDRGDRMALFNKPNSEYDIFLLSTRAGGLGLNLQTADTVIIFDSDWNPQMDLQAQDRAHRIGQKKKVLVLRFITNTPIEEAILQKAAFKMNLDELFIQGGLYNLSSSEAERRKKIEDVLKRTNKDEEDIDGDEIPDDETLNDWIARDEVNFFLIFRMNMKGSVRWTKKGTSKTALLTSISHKISI
jgi:SNF2 family DNA or RNA helicase